MDRAGPHLGSSPVEEVEVEVQRVNLLELLEHNVYMFKGPFQTSDDPSLDPALDTLSLTNRSC